MMPIDALCELLGRFGASRGAAVLVDAEELKNWPSDAVKALKYQKLIVKACPASSAICPGCERECAMPVHTLPAKAGDSASFIVCDKRSDINRVPVSSDRLVRWRCSIDRVSEFVASGLSLRRIAGKEDAAGRREIGIAFGDKRSQMLCLEANGPLTLVAGNSKVPLADFIEFRDGRYSLDSAKVRMLVDASTTGDSRYTPSLARREARKLDTQAMHESWRKAYRELKEKKPGKSDSWYSKQISKMDISQGRDSETIRKNMKG